MVVQMNYRIFPDPADPKLWAYEVRQGQKVVKIVAGFKTAKDAKRAYDRSRKN